MDTNKTVQELKIERQKFQMHKDGYANIVKAIESTNKIEVNMKEFKPLDLSETNKILVKLVEKINEPLCITLELN